MVQQWESLDQSPESPQTRTAPRAIILQRPLLPSDSPPLSYRVEVSLIARQLSIRKGEIDATTAAIDGSADALESLALERREPARLLLGKVIQFRSVEVDIVELPLP